MRSASVRETFNACSSAWLANAHLLHAAAFQALGDEAGEAMSLDLADAILDRIPNPGALRARSEHLRQHLHGAARHLTEFGEELSGREIAVLRLAADGLTQREIADQLFISYNTVKTHLKATYRKLGATSRDEAVRRLAELDVLPSSARPKQGSPG